jgi:hypothetical protein
MMRCAFTVEETKGTFALSYPAIRQSLFRLKLKK